MSAILPSFGQLSSIFCWLSLSAAAAAGEVTTKNSQQGGHRSKHHHGKSKLFLLKSPTKMALFCKKRLNIWLTCLQETCQFSACSLFWQRQRSKRSPQRLFLNSHEKKFSRVSGGGGVTTQKKNIGNATLF